jgi:hypothetical protein
MDHFPTTLPGIGVVPGIGEFSLPPARLAPPTGPQPNSAWRPNWGNPRPQPEAIVELMVQACQTVSRGKFLGNGYWQLEGGGCVSDGYVTHWRTPAMR